MIGWGDTQKEGKVAVRANVLGHEIAVLRKDIENIEEGQDPYFFEEDYSVAASTAWLVWEGSWALIESLGREHDPWLRELVQGKRVLELGAGTGLLGLAVAAAGGHCVLTDVSSMTEGSLRPNVEGNDTPIHGEAATARSSNSAQHPANDTRLPGWTENGSRVGPRGSADVQALDWYKPVGEQRSPVDVMAAEVILAAECAWLAELVEPFITTLVALLSGPHAPICVLAFRERASDSSKAFIGRSALLTKLSKAGCDVKWRESIHGREGKEEGVGGNITEVYLVRKGGGCSEMQPTSSTRT